MQSLIRFDAPLPARKTPLVLALGVFDGVHTGHKKIISELLVLARKHNAVPAAVTFSPHPRALLHPAEPPVLLLPLEERCRLLHCAGADLTGVISFTEAVAGMEPEAFLEDLVSSEGFTLAGICVGSQWRFGRRGKGCQETIRRFAEKYQIDFVPCRELELDGQTVSSSAIRRLTAAGDLAAAEAMLGRPVRLFGRVEQGNRIAGKVLNAPTANITVEYGVLPPDGVYSGSVPVEGKNYPAVVNIGFSPTFQGKIRRVETHLLDFEGSLYGKELELELFDFLRPEKSFSSPEELAEQIKKDISAAREDHIYAKGKDK